MLLSLFYVILGLALLAGGAEGLVRAGSSIALRLGVTPLVVGLTIVSMGTGSPELVIAVQAAFFDNGGLALGSVVGSNISNTALILGAAALVYPLRARTQVVRREMPVMIGVTAALWLMVADGELSRFDGFLLLLGSVAYTALVYYLARRTKRNEVHISFAESVPEASSSPWIDAVFLAGGIALLVIGANLLIEGAVAIANFLQIPQVVIGLTLIAVGTSLPELATSTVAAYRKESDLALGNAIGSNIVNITVILGAAALVNPFSTNEIRSTDMAVMLGLPLLLWALLGWRFLLDRLEAIILLVIYFLYIYTLIP